MASDDTGDEGEAAGRQASGNPKAPIGREERDLRFLRRELNKLARAQLHLREKFFSLHEGVNRMYGSVSALTPVDYPDELLPVIPLEAEGEDILFLAFGGLNLGLGMPPAEFLKSLRRRDIPGYFIKDFHQSWYQQGLIGISSDALGTADYLRELLARRRYKRLVTLGSSSGGYAAILYGCMLGAERALAFSPQTTITDRIVSQYKAIDTPEPMSFLKRNRGLHDLRAFIDAQSHVPETTVYYGADHPRDPEEALRLDGHPRMTLVSVPDVQVHTVTAELKARGELDAILDRLVTF